MHPKTVCLALSILSIVAGALDMVMGFRHAGPED